MSQLVRAHLIVEGIVQGVFFRANMRDIATRYGVTGWVRNLPDGRRVEAVIEGPKDNVDKVICWALNGPPLAKVEKITVEYSVYKGEFKNFAIRYF